MYCHEPTYGQATTAFLSQPVYVFDLSVNMPFLILVTQLIHNCVVVVRGIQTLIHVSFSVAEKTVKA